ncbi:MAG: GNAT family N-acetyltransferase [Immundisolibacter sp.]|uniref:GNAT family N-acetyltransferase n=1 Tax=Immundisolibacter sp. TaxID=1934948 RepID=UPI003EE073DE
MVNAGDAAGQSQPAALAVARWVRDEAEFVALETDWNRLCAAMPQATVFHRHEWFAAAWQWQRHSHALAILVVEQAGLPIAIAPLAKRLAPAGHGPARHRVLEFLLVPDSQCCDLIASPSHLPTALPALIYALRAIAGEWDQLRLRLLPADSPSVEALYVALAQGGLLPCYAATDSNPFIALRGGWPTYYAGRSRRLKKGNNLAANHLRKAGSIELQHVSGVLSDDQTGKLLHTLTTVSTQSWKRRTGNTLEQAGPGAFFAALTRTAGRHGWLSVWLLKLNDVVIATEYQLRFGGCVHALRSDFDPAHDGLSPGTYLNWKLIEALFEVAPDERYCFGPGGNPYKQRWAQDARPLLTLTAWSPSLRGRLGGFWYQRLRPWAKRVLRRVPASVAQDDKEQA